MTTRSSGLLPQIILPDVIFEKFEGPCGHDNPSLGAFAQIIFPDVIFEKFKSPCGHDNPSFGAFTPNYFCQVSFLRNLKAPAGMTTRRSGLLPQIIFAGCLF